MEITQLIQTALNLPVPAIAYYVSQQLTEWFPQKGLIEGNDCAFHLEGYIRAGHCTAQQSDIMHNQSGTYWHARANVAFQTPKNVWWEVTWQQHKLDVLTLNWYSDYGSERCYWVLAETQPIAQAFFAAVCEWHTEIRDEVLVFEHGMWAKDPELFRAIKGMTLENLVLAGTLKQEIKADLDNFFSSLAVYREYDIPWKRGILLIGPPGNGKTHAVKALLNSLQKPCLYVKSLKSYTTESENIRQVFYKARQSAPCVLVLEDLDSLLNKHNRSFFLNELDGFALNEGIVTLATTNYPERLDPAIIDRPSRFDRKYHFDLPALSERQTYIQLWNHKLKPAMQLTDAGIAAVAEQTEKFSFAYLKELFLSSMMTWAAKMTAGSMDQVMLSQIGGLRSQMESAPAQNSSPEELDESFDETYL
jgi:DNA polymerase III delta prime subunit